MLDTPPPCSGPCPGRPLRVRVCCLPILPQYVLERGQRLTEVLKQPQFRPMPIEQQVVVIYAATTGYMDKVPVAAITAAETAVLKHVDPKIYKVGLGLGLCEHVRGA